MKRRSIILVVVLALLGVAVVLTWRNTRERRVATPTVAPPTAASAKTNAMPKNDVSSANDVAGVWEGSLQVQAATLRLVLKVNRAAGGGYAATLDSVDQGAKDIPVNTLTVSNRTVRVELSALGAAYEAEINARATEMSGQWRQGPLSLPLTMLRTTTPSTVASPLPPAAYTRRSDAPLQGWWAGALKVRDTSLRVLFKFTSPASGVYQGTLDSLDQGAKTIPINVIALNAPDVRLEIDAIGGHFEGTMTADGSGIHGTWTQGGGNLPLQLQRTEPVADAPVPASAYTFARELEPQGVWNGTLDLGQTKLRLVIKIAKLAENDYRATLDSPDQGGRDIPATSVIIKDTDVEVEWKALRALYHGQLEKGRLTGFWQQGPDEFPLELERTNRLSGATKPLQ